VARFHREARAAARLSHPNSVALLDSGETETGTLFMVMELVPGVTLAQLLSTAGPLGEARAVGICAQILAALSEAHGLGIIHRDLKPANVMVDPRDGTDRVKVLDFGIATVAGGDLESRLTQQGTVFGTPAYMSPEQVRGEPLDPRSDLYSVGVILHEILAGRLPFEAETPLGLASRHLHDPPPPLSRAGVRVGPALERLVLSALAKRREDRPATADAFRTALLACPFEPAAGPAPEATLPPTLPLASADVPAPPRTTLPMQPRARGRGLAWTAGAVVAAALAAIGWRAAVQDAPPGPVSRADDAARADRSPEDRRAKPLEDAGDAAGPARRSSVDPARMPATRGETERGAADEATPAPPIRRARDEERRTTAPPPARLPPTPAPIRAVRAELNSLPLPPADSGEGLLALEASPWAHVAVDGQELGESPREVQLGAGPHRVRAVHPEYGTREAHVTVKAGHRTVWVAAFD